MALEAVSLDPVQAASVDQPPVALTAAEVSTDAALMEVMEHLWQAVMSGKLKASAFMTFVEVSTPAAKVHDLFLEAAQLAIGYGVGTTARQLLQRGIEIDPTNAVRQKLARIIAPAKVLPTRAIENVDLSSTMRWLSQYSASYVGKWVAVQDGTLLGVSDRRRTLVDQLGDKAKARTTLITRIP